MTLVGFLVLAGWVPAVLFLYFHGRTHWWRRPAGQSVFVMAVVVAIAMTVAFFRVTLQIPMPEEVRAFAYLMILVALWWQLITILRYLYGNPGGSTSTLNPGSRLGDREESR